MFSNPSITSSWYLSLPATHPCGELGQSGRSLRGAVIEDQESTHGGARYQNVTHQARALRCLRVVILRDLAADGYAGAYIEVREDGVADGSADVVEISVDAARAQLAQGGCVIAGGLVIERSVEAAFAGQILGFLRTAGDAHHAASGDLRHLSGD